MAGEDTVKDDVRVTNPATESQEISKVTIKIPPFWVEKPEIWFYQIEAQFAINRITCEETKFNYLVSQLKPKYIDNIWDIIKSNVLTKYTLAKERLLGIFKESEEKRIKRLVTGIELGDYKPSQLMRKMKSLAGADISKKVLKTLWLEKLPDSVKNILIVSAEDLDRLALMADRIVEMSPRNELYSLNSQQQESQGALADILKKISSLEQKVASISMTRSRGRSNSRSRSSSHSRKKFNPEGRYCYYHFRFGNRCQPEKCKQPCSWKQPSEN